MQGVTIRVTHMYLSGLPQYAREALSMAPIARYRMWSLSHTVSRSTLPDMQEHTPHIQTAVHTSRGAKH